jgi:hypothetical protein
MIGPGGFAPVFSAGTLGASIARSATSPNPSRLLDRETFGQVTSTTDPFNPWGLSTPFMFAPWSTPFSGWTNAQTWNWWRERSGALPPNW